MDQPLKLVQKHQREGAKRAAITRSKKTTCKTKSRKCCCQDFNNKQEIEGIELKDVSS